MSGNQFSNTPYYRVSLFPYFMIWVSDRISSSYYFRALFIIDISYVSEEGDTYGAEHDMSTMYSEQSATLDLTQLCDRLADLEPEDYYPLIISE